MEHWIALDAEIAWCDARIAEHARSDEQARQAARIQGIGPLGASAMVAGVGDFRQFAAPTSSLLGWAWCRANTPAEAIQSWVASPDEATTIFEPF